MKLAFKRLNLVPQGSVTGGFFEYSLDPQAGTITYQGEVDARFMFFSKVLPLNGTAAIDPACILSKNIAPGNVFNFGNLKVNISNIITKKAYANVEANVSGVPVSGTATFDISGDTIVLIYVKLSGSYFGVGVVVEATAAA